MQWCKLYRLLTFLTKYSLDLEPCFFLSFDIASLISMTDSGVRLIFRQIFLRRVDVGPGWGFEDVGWRWAFAVDFTCKTQQKTIGFS